jgi:hypothetical protein
MHCKLIFLTEPHICYNIQAVTFFSVLNEMFTKGQTLVKLRHVICCTLHVMAMTQVSELRRNSLFYTTDVIGKGKVTPLQAGLWPRWG